jgi:putative transposase
MQKTICLKLVSPLEDSQKLLSTQKLFAQLCNEIAIYAQANRCWNQVALHHLCYYAVREKFPLVGSQMVCNAIRRVCSSYKVLKIKKDAQVPLITFRDTTAVHYCARTFTLKDNRVSLFTVKGRVRCAFALGKKQQELLAQGKVKEADLIRRNNEWFLNVVIELPDVPHKEEGGYLGVDLGENNLAATSSGTIYGGAKLRHERDLFLNRRRKLQSNGSPSAKRKLKKISGQEKRRVKEKNHVVAKEIVQEALRAGARIIVLEDLTNIRKRIKGNKRLRSRLHRWSFGQLQTFIEYKAAAEGIQTLYVSPAYTSQTCSACAEQGERKRHLFVCSNCGSYQHSDRNAAINLCKLGKEPPYQRHCQHADGSSP